MDEETTGRLPDDDAEATRIAPGAGADAEATRIAPGAGDEATRVMPPPPPAQPTLVMARGRGPEGRGMPWWAWLVVVLALVAAAAILWFALLRPQTTTSTVAGQEFLGTWAPESGAGGGLVIKQADDQFLVTQYDGQLRKAGSTTATLVDSRLELTVQASALGLDGITGTVQGTLTHEKAGDRLKLQFSAGSLTIAPVYYVRTDVLLPASPSPTPTPTASPSPTPSPSLSPTSSPSPSPSGSPTSDQDAITGIGKIQAGVIAWAADNNGLYPPPQDVVEGGGISHYVDPWPTNPFTGQPMTPGTSPGSYVYEQLSGGQGYKLTGYLSSGLTYSVP